MKLFYAVIVMLLIASLVGLEIVTARLVQEPITPAELRGATAPVVHVSGS